MMFHVKHARTTANPDLLNIVRSQLMAKQFLIASTLTEERCHLPVVVDYPSGSLCVRHYKARSD
jgi:hypothetical protein